MEQTKDIIAWEILLILIFSSLLIINSTNSITGRAVQSVTKESIQTELETAVPKLQFANDITDVSLCLIVSINPLISYSYEIIKIGDATAVTISDNKFCKGQDKEDFVVAYVSYDKLEQDISSPPTVQDLKQQSDGTYFNLLPSKEILAGGKAANPTELDSKVGTVLRKYLSSTEVKAILASSNPQEQQASSLASYLLYFVIGMVVLILVISLLIMKFSKKPEIAVDLELVSYIKSALAQGFAEDQITQSLLQSGWKEEKIQEAFKSLNSGATAPGLLP